MAATKRYLRSKKRFRAQRRRKDGGRKRTMKSGKQKQKRSARTGAKMTKKPKSDRMRMRMTREASGMLHSFVDGIYKKVSEEAERLRRKGGRTSIISSDVQSALRQVMPRRYTRLVAYSKSH